MIVMVSELGKCLFSSEVRATMQVWLLLVLPSYVQKETKKGANKKRKDFSVRCLLKISAGCFKLHHYYKSTLP